MTAKTKSKLVVLEPVADGRLYPVQSGEKLYHVDPSSGECDCPAFWFQCPENRKLCKHARAVALHLKEINACPFCYGRGCVTAYAPFPYVNANGTLSIEPLACVVCSGSGRVEERSA